MLPDNACVGITQGTFGAGGFEAPFDSHGGVEPAIHVVKAINYMHQTPLQDERLLVLDRTCNNLATRILHSVQTQCAKD